MSWSIHGQASIEIPSFRRKIKSIRSSRLIDSAFYSTVGPIMRLSSFKSAARRIASSSSSAVMQGDYKALASPCKAFRWLGLTSDPGGAGDKNPVLRPSLRLWPRPNQARGSVGSEGEHEPGSNRIRKPMSHRPSPITRYIRIRVVYCFCSRKL